jgi:hypothetical protein
LAARNTELDRLLEDLHRQCSGGRVAEAYKQLESYLATSPSDADEVVHNRLLHFAHEDLLLEHAVHYLGRLLENGKRQRAWELFRTCHAREPRFRLARLMHENWHRDDEAIAVLREIKTAHPAFAATAQFRSLVLSIRDR